MPTHAELWHWLLQSLSQVSSPTTEADWLFEHLTGLSPLQRHLASDEAVTKAVWQQAQVLLKQRQDHEPLQYLLGYTWFYGLKLTVTPDVLIPRPETEELVALVLAQIPLAAAWRVLDMGTGSGAIAIAIAQKRPQCRVWATDISEAALAVAFQNAQHLGVADRITFMLGHQLAPVIQHGIKAQVLVSNPPYISEAEFIHLQADVRDYEPLIALVSTGNPLAFYHDLAATLPRVLLPGGLLAVEMNNRFAAETLACFQKYAYCQDLNIQRDMQQLERFVTLRYRV